MVLQVAGTKTASSPKKLECRDGDPACDSDGQCHNGSCTFKVQACPNRPGIAGCTPGSLTSLTARVKGGANLPQPRSLSGSECGATLDVVVPLRGKKKNKPGRKTVVLVATATSGKPKKDRDRDVLVCLPTPPAQACEVTRTCEVPSNVTCEPLVPDGRGIPGTYQLLSVQGPKLCQTNATQNQFGRCNTDADCGGGPGNCSITPFATGDSFVLPFPQGIKTIFTIKAEDPPPHCSHSLCVECGNEAALCAGIPGCGSTPGQPAPGCIRNQCCDHPGFTIPTFLIPSLGFCSRLDMYRCGVGVVNSSNPQVGDNEVTKTGDTSDPGADCCYNGQPGSECLGGVNLNDDPRPKPCTTDPGGAGSDAKGKVVRTVGNGACDANGVQYRVALPALSTTWIPPGGRQGCTPEATFDPGETLLSQIVLNAEFTTAGATGSFADLNGDGCALAKGAAGFTNLNKNGPFTLGSPPAAPQPYDASSCAAGSACSTAVSAGVALTGGPPLFELGFVAVLTNAAMTRLPMQSCTCTPVPACPE